jgi:hypothetical protein
VSAAFIRRLLRKAALAAAEPSEMLVRVRPRRVVAQVDLAE